MSHNTAGRTIVTLDTFSGLASIASARDLVKGASPRLQNVDFSVGGVKTRNSLVNEFSFAGASQGPDPGTSAVGSAPGGSVPWTSPTSVLADDGAFATATLGGALSVTPTPISAISTQSLPSFATIWNNTGGLLSTIPSVFASCNLVTGQGSQFFAVGGLGGVGGMGLPPAAVIVGIQISVHASCPFNQPMFVQLIRGGGSPSNAIGSPLTQTVTSAGFATYTFGNSSFLWGATGMTGAFVNAPSFGAAIWMPSAAGTGTAKLYGFTITVTYTSSVAGDIAVTQFAFNVPTTSSTPVGIQAIIKGFASAPAAVDLQLIKNGVVVGSVRSAPLPIGSSGTIILGGQTDLWGSSWVNSDFNNINFGVQLSATPVGTSTTTVSLGFVTLQVFYSSGSSNFNYVTTFEDAFGNIRTLAIDATGQWWVEDVNGDVGVLSPLFNGPPANSYASSFTADSRQYIATNDLNTGDYIPVQYTGPDGWIDRVSQVGPGAAPTFTPIVGASNQYAIDEITQPAQQSFAFAYFLQSSGPGSTSPGNVATVYYQDSTVVPTPDQDLVDAVNSGFPVYAYLSFAGTAEPFPATVVQITSVGEASPPNQPRKFFYLTFNVPGVAFTYFQGSGHSGFVVTYQRSLATMTMDEPVPGLAVGNSVTISGNTAYDGQHTISEALNSGTVTITQTVVASGVATYSYSLVTGQPPAAGQLVTITGTTNDNGTLNLTTATIDTASGGATGTFTILVSLPDAGASAEQGQATTAGTIFDFDPGAALVGGTSTPIIGTGTGGTLTFVAATAQLVTQGTKQGTVFFITRNGYWTAPGPPVTFSLPANTVAIQAAHIPIGPPNVVARGIAFTESGQLGVPGGNFYTIPDPETYIVQNQSYTASSLFINDNTTDTASFAFTDFVLLKATEIDIQGNDLFSLGELGEAGWCTQYAGRTVWGRVRNKIQNFLNLTFDGGYLANPGAQLAPLGWTTPDQYGTLLVSPIFGNSYYIKNTTGIVQNNYGQIFQSAYQDAFKQPIILPNTTYSARITCRNPSGNGVGNLVMQVMSGGLGLGAIVLNLGPMTANMQTLTGTFIRTPLPTVPADLQLTVYGANFATGADCEIDSIEIYPTEDPVNLTGITFSYQNDPESFDLTTGGNDTNVLNAQPANGAFVLHDTLYVVKESSLGYFTDTPNQEPANWNPFKEVSNVCGASGINAWDVGEEWAIMACQNGLFIFNGGQPTPINIEIPDLWQSINWNAGNTIVVRNDVANRRIYCAIPLPTPNPWMIDATVNTNPTTPNVILFLNYEGIGSVDELMQASSLHVTMTGKLAVHDIRRKWALWTIPTPYIGWIKRGELLSKMLFCNGIGSSKVYSLSTSPSGLDDGTAFTSSYCTYGFADQEEKEGNPMLGLLNLRWVYGDALIDGSGGASLTFFQNTLTALYPFSVPGGLDLIADAPNDFEFNLDEYAQRLFSEIQVTGGWFDFSGMMLVGAQDMWNTLRGKSR